MGRGTLVPAKLLSCSRGVKKAVLAGINTDDRGQTKIGDVVYKLYLRKAQGKKPGTRDFSIAECEFKIKESGVRNQTTEDRSQRSEDRGQTTDDRL